MPTVETDSDDDDNTQVVEKRTRGRKKGNCHGRYKCHTLCDLALSLICYHFMKRTFRDLIISCTPTGEKGKYKDIAEKGRALLDQCNNDLKTASKDQIEEARMTWEEWRTLETKRTNDKHPSSWGTAGDRHVYKILHAFFMDLALPSDALRGGVGGPVEGWGQILTPSFFYRFDIPIT